MEWKIPFFEYDVFARIAPGSLTIAVAQYVDATLMPKYWEPLLPITSKGTALDMGIVLFGGLTLLGASYVVGLIYEGFFSLFLPLISRKVLISLAKDRQSWRRPVWAGEPAFHEIDLFKILMQWLICSKDEGVRLAFVHFHRFQAEARLCAYSVAPLGILSGVAGSRGERWTCFWSAVMAILFALCAIFRERRRLVQALSILDELRPDGDPQLELLQRQLQGYWAEKVDTVNEKKEK